MFGTVTVLSLLTAASPDTRVIAVFPISAEDVLDDETSAAIHSTLEADLVQTGRFTVVAQAELRKAVQAKKRDSFFDCFDEACRIEVGKEVAAEEILTSQITPLAGECEVSLKLYSLRLAASSEAASTVDKCSKAGVRRAIRSAAYKLAGVELPTPAVIAPSAGFGTGLGTLPSLPQVGAFTADVPRSGLGRVDIEERKLLAAAKKVDRSKTALYLERARSWERLAAHSRTGLLAEQARTRAILWRNTNRDACARRKKLNEVRMRRAIDKQKLKALLALDADGATEAEKNSWQQEYEAAYKPWLAPLDEPSDPRTSCLPRDMVQVPGGPFLLGCNEPVDDDCESREPEAQPAIVATYGIDKTEVTVSAFRQCVHAGECRWETFKSIDDDDDCNWGHRDRDSHPMNCVNWFGAQDFCRFRGKRLPTNEEWEKAARGAKGLKYPWGNEPEATCAHAILDDGPDGCGRDSTWPVGSKPAGRSPYGIHDMAGNVHEWTSDWFEPNKTRSLRGGSWYDDPEAARASARHRLPPAARKPSVGFRCAQSD